MPETRSMLIENFMYFALGVLVAALIALIIMPAVWKRAVRLTKRRIEAATPITLAEFRADKDQLRAEFALSTRRLEMTIEGLRQRLAEQVSDASQKRTDLGLLKVERDKHAAIVAELEAREAELRERILQMEKEVTDLTQRLRMRERDVETRNAEIEALRKSLRGEQPDVRALATVDDDTKAESLTAAEARIANAETRLNALLAETAAAATPVGVGQGGPLLADTLSMEEELDKLHSRISNVENTIANDWQTERFEGDALREKLNDIAASVSRVVYAPDHATAPRIDPEESLFDRVQRFADDGETLDLLPMPTQNQGGAVSDRLTALREIQGR
jgi:DNA repair exonuclease SbcCD ATPase subunit